MIWWIGGGVIAFAVVVFGVVLIGALASLRRFSDAARSLQRRLLDGEQRLAPALATLQERALALEGPLVAAQEQQAILAARSGDRSDG